MNGKSITRCASLSKIFGAPTLCAATMLFSVSATDAVAASGLVKLSDIYPSAAQPEASLAIGGSFDNARKSLLRSGFAPDNPMSDGCLFRRNQGDRIRVVLSTGNGRCTPGQPIRLIRYYRTIPGTRHDAPSAIAQLNRRIGAEARCNLVAKTNAFCNWNDPARFPALSMVKLDVTASVLTVTLRAAAGSPSPPPAVTGGAFDPRAAIRNIDPLAPGGVRLGAPLADVARSLGRSGFVATGYGSRATSCHWRFTRANEVDVKIVIKPELKTAAGTSSACVAGAKVRNVSFSKVDNRPDFVAREPDSPGMIAAWRKRLRAPASAQCQSSKTGMGTDAQCRWSGPAVAGIASATIRHSRYGKRKATADITLVGAR